MTANALRLSRIAAAIGIAAIAWPTAQAAGVLADIQKGTISIKLNPVVTGLGAPDYAISAPGDTNRLFVVEQKGTLLAVQNGSLLPSPVLDMQSRIGGAFNPANANDERGLLGLAFHPDFNKAGSAGYQTLYTFGSEPLGSGATFAAPNGATQNYKTVVAEWKMSATNANSVDPGSYREVVSFGKNASNHNGGTITFGKDGYLYVGLGDGGNANDVGASHLEPPGSVVGNRSATGGNSQNLSTPLGKMLRIDPLAPTLTSGSTSPISANNQYRIPIDNPFQGVGQVAEIYAYGFRNPYRFSVDTLTGQIIVADVGQNNIEEINLLQKGGNYGWAVKEGTFIFDRNTGQIGANSPGDARGLTLVDPITGSIGTLQYDHTDGISITGGFVYRGSLITELQGKYVFGDLALRNAPPRVDGRLFYADLETGEIKEFLIPQFADDKLPDGLTVHGFGQDGNGEIYALVTNTPANGSGGILYMFAPVPEPGTWAMFGVGMLLFVGRLRGRARRAGDIRFARWAPDQ